MNTASVRRHMQTKTPYEDEILKEVRDLPGQIQEKLARILHIIKQELMDAPGFDEKKATDDFLTVCGTWEDDRSPETQIQDIHAGRTSTMRMENAF